MLKYKKILAMMCAVSISVLCLSSFGYCQTNEPVVSIEKVEKTDEVENFLKNFIDSRIKIFIDKKSDVNKFKELYNVSENVKKSSAVSNKLTAFSNKLSKSKDIQQSFGNRLRKAKEVIGRDYFKSETSVKINSIKATGDNIYEVSAKETTKLYYKAFNEPEAYEAFSDDHIFSIMKVNNEYIVLNEELPDSLISMDYSSKKNKTDMLPPSDIKKKTPKAAASSSTLTASSSTVYYDGEVAADYADQYYENYNTGSYRTFTPSDCTNYLSQCLKAGWNGKQDSSGYNKWFYYFPGYVVNVGYTASWGAAQNSYEYWYYHQNTTDKYSERFSSTPPSNWTRLPDSHPIWECTDNGSPVYYHTDPDSAVYYNHAAIITGKSGTLDDFGNFVTWRPYVNSHTNDRYHVDYTLYPYLNYQEMIDNGYTPSIAILKITDWSADD